MELLDQTWHDALGQQAGTEMGRYLLKAIVEKYSESHRCYHNRVHIEKMLRFIQANKAYGQSTHALSLATIFHDVIYDPQEKDNEEKSADFARHALLTLKMDAKYVEEIETLILCTKHHQAQNGNPDSFLIVDADLSILSSPDAEYDDYAIAIRSEYSFLNDDDYRVGRTKVLQSFLDRESIFVSPELESRIGERARENVRREISSLVG